MSLPKMEVNYRIEGMDCANCALTLERGIAQVQGVEQVQVSFSTANLQASGIFDPQAVVERVQALGYRVASPGGPASGRMEARATGDGLFGYMRYLLSERRTAIALASAGLLLLSAPLGWFPQVILAHPIQVSLHVLVVLLAGVPIARKGWKALWVAHQITIDLLMSIATLGALFIGETGEAATVILLFAAGEALEAYTAERARNSLRSLLALKPEQAAVLRPCLDCDEHLGQEGYTGGPCPYCGSHAARVPVEQVGLGEIVLVRPGERIPVDGRVRNGTSAINQASVTGESLPVVKSAGEEVFAGTLNGEGALEVQVTHLAQDSTISRIVRLVEQAQARRAPVERFIDRFAAWYTPVVVLVAMVLAVVPPLVFGAPFLDLPDGTHGWLYRALALLIIACPCALVISTPVTVVSALSGLARRGVLVKGGVFLDALSRVKVFAFDKTGTLTRGYPVVRQTLTLDCLPGQERCPSCDDMLALAAAVESRSEHPLAQAILAESRTRQIGHRYPDASEVSILAGKAVQGLVNGSVLTVGSHVHSHEFLSEHNDLHQKIENAEQDGQTVMLVSKDDTVLGFVSVSDVLRETSQQSLLELKAIDPAFHTVMLTGDHPQAAQSIARGIQGLDEVLAGLLPEDKVGVVQELQARRGAVAMVGDGINDAPALATSTVGIAMGGAGTAQAMETADVVLMQDDLTHLPDAVRTSRQAQVVIWQNIAFSLAVKAVFLVLVLPGWATMWMAVFADMGASLLVTLNGIRMLKVSK